MINYNTYQIYLCFGFKFYACYHPESNFKNIFSDAYDECVITISPCEKVRLKNVDMI